MAFTSFAAWSVIFGLSLMSVGGFVLWAYGGAQTQPEALATEGPENEATHHLHQNLVHWFFIYGVLSIIAGLVFLLWAAAVFL